MINPVFAIAAVLGVLLPLLPSKDTRTQRRLYWAGTLVASVSSFLALYPPDWRGGLGLAGAVAGVQVLRAYMSTTHLVFRGRTYAFDLRHSSSSEAGDDAAPASYGGLATAQKTWWLLVVIVIACTTMVALYAVTRTGPWYPIGAVAAVGIVAISLGFQDGSWEYPVARGQLLQFAVTGIASVGVFAALYYGAYAAGRRWPLRSKRSMDYRAHPHLRKKFPK